MFHPTILLLPLIIGLNCGLSTSTPSSGITNDDLLKIFQSVSLETVRDPISALGNDSRQRVQPFLRERLSRIAATGGGSQAGHSFLEQAFQTKVFADDGQTEKTVRGVNFIVVLHGHKNGSSKMEENDKKGPLVILANYDTDMHQSNPIDDNGSGVVALIALGEYLASQIATKKIHLDRSVILAATDLALSKYDDGKPGDSTTGAGHLVKNWLPNFLNGKKLTGAIVLDSIMNFNEQSRSQTDSSDFSKSFASAYQEMSHSEFKGNFLALIQRDDHLDNPLAGAFQRGWARSQSDETESIDPKLIPFKFQTPPLNTNAEIYFLVCEQSEFWNHFATRSTKEYPAILLTDTKRYRQSECDRSGCSLPKMATPKNLGFMRRTTMAVYSTIVDLQSDAVENGVSSRSEIPTLTLLLVTFAGAILYRL